METKDLEEVIRNIIIQELRYFKNYTGKIIDVEDPLKKGRIKCYILELGWLSGESAVWVNPRYINKMLKLKIDDYVEISFMNGDRNRPCYNGKIQELKNMAPFKYDGAKQVLFESNSGKLYITYDDTIKELYIQDESNNAIKLSSTGLDLLSATESFLKGDTWKTNWTTLNSAIQAITPSNPVTSAQFAALQTAFNTFFAQVTNMLSTKIKGE